MNPETHQTPAQQSPSSQRRLWRVAGYLGAAALGSIGTWIAVGPLAKLFGPARVSVVNVTGSDLLNVRVEAGVSYQVHPVIGSGSRVTSDLRPNDSQEVMVTFQTPSGLRRATCGMIDVGEQRTVTILEGGQKVIISFGTADAVVHIYDTEPVPAKKPE